MHESLTSDPRRGLQDQLCIALVPAVLREPTIPDFRSQLSLISGALLKRINIMSATPQRGGLSKTFTSVLNKCYKVTIPVLLLDCIDLGRSFRGFNLGVQVHHHLDQKMECMVRQVEFFTKHLTLR
ncbi:hypothetical protein RRG08_062008 [Elysia crispata]|uniref:Uncharacterized protein n=1 Tax=Elysia crispata TaxID=231223 RepID=A0AAE1A4Z5_9GAST|nr:hypothetical protein RRG08_062008 [Elysia crispata]